MNKKKFADNVMTKIKKGKIKPLSKWNFLLKQWVFWAMFGVSVLLGGIAVSVILFLIRTSDFDVFAEIDGGLVSVFLMSIPYVWIVIMLAFAYIAFYNYKHTDTGYRHSFSFIYIISVLMSFILGIVFLPVGVAEFIDEGLINNMPFYREFHMGEMGKWNRVDDGFLGGKIIFIGSMGGIKIQDFKLHEWNVDTKGAVMGNRVRMMEGELVKIIGEKMNENSFKANEIRVFERKLNFMKEMLR